MTTGDSDKNKVIIKNTMVLYLRMIFIVLISLYTSRLVLASLGVVNFGIYNVIASVIVFFSFLQNAITLATQRYISFGLGSNDLEHTKKIFITSLNVHLLMCVIAFLFLKILGEWFLNTYLSIPSEKIDNAIIVYNISIFTLLIQIMQTPFSAAIIAFEKMSIYAYVGIFDALLKFLSSVAIYYFPFQNVLVTYALLLLINAFLVVFIYITYCYKRLPFCEIRWFFDLSLFGKLINFSSWSLIGSLSVVGVAQGVAIVINIFWGVIANAALGIAEQIGVAISKFVGGFQTAFNPQIIKSYARKDIIYLNALISKSSRFSYYLMLIICIPLLIKTDQVLTLWLGSVPEYTVGFSRLIIVYILIDSLAGPFVTVIYATGDLKKYQLTISFMMFMNFLFALFIIMLGFNPLYAVGVRVIFSLITLVTRVFFVKNITRYNLSDFFISTFFRVISITTICYLCSYFGSFVIKSDGYSFLLYVLSSFVFSSLTIYSIGLKSDERKYLHELFFKYKKSI